MAALGRAAPDRRVRRTPRPRDLQRVRGLHPHRISRPRPSFRRLAGQSFEIRRRPGVSAAVGAQIQNDLISHDVQARLNAGLGSNPLGFPDRPIPIFLVPGKFDSDGDQGRHLGDLLRQLRSRRSSRGPTTTPQERASTAAHELFHAYSAGVPPTTGRPVRHWWEEASATWSEQKNGFNEPDKYEQPVDPPPGARPQRPQGNHEYAHVALRPVPRRPRVHRAGRRRLAARSAR